MANPAFGDARSVVSNVLEEARSKPDVFEGGTVSSAILKPALASTVHYLMQKVEQQQQQLQQAQLLQQELEEEKEMVRLLREEMMRLKKKLPKEVARFPPPPVVDPVKTAEDAANALVHAADIMGPAVENMAKTHNTEPPPEDAPRVIRKQFDGVELEQLADWEEVDEEVLWQRQKRFVGPRQAICMAFREGRCAPAQWRTCGRAHLPHCFDPRCVDIEQRKKCKHVWHSKEENDPGFAKDNKHASKAMNQGNAPRPEKKKPTSNPAVKGNNGSNNKRSGPSKPNMGSSATFKRGKVPPARAWNKSKPKPTVDDEEEFPKLQSRLQVAEAKLAVYEGDTSKSKSESSDDDDFKMFLKFKKFMQLQKA